MTDHAASAPARPRARRNWILAGALVVLLTPLFLGVPAHLRHDPLISPLADRYHVVLFAVLTVLLHAHGPLARRPWAVIVVCLALGGASELLQTLVGRSAMWLDWYQDAIGIGLGVCWIAARRAPRLALAAALVLLGLVAWPLRHLGSAVREARAATVRFPLLDDFERPDALRLWAGHMGGEVARVPADDHGHVLELTHHGDEPWPGAVSRRLPYDWSGHAVLRLDCRLRAPSPDSLRVAVWLADRRTGRDRDYATSTFTVDHRWRTLSVRLADLITHNRTRALDLDEILAVSVFYAGRDHPGAVVQIDNVRLADH